ncbi:MAG: cupin domain-containing protein [Acidobacteriaceae bacterium]|nr:cupin domain-containing protein [Acidobacteriaceae bacterium]
MKLNRRMLFGFAATLLALFRAKAQPALAKSSAKEIARHALSGPQQGMEAVLVDVTSAAGAPSHLHRHPSFVLGYVLDGELKFAINNAAPQVIPRGGTFFEPAGAVHSTGESAEPAQPVRFLAFLVVPTGSPIVLPA